MSAQVTLIGNLTKDPELRFTTKGTPVANFTVACTSRIWSKEEQKFVDSNTVFMNVIAWHKLAENVADTFHKGNQCVVIGELQQRSFEDKNGDTKTVYEVKAEHVAASMRFNSAMLNAKTTAHPSTGMTDDPWATKDPDNEIPF